MVCRANSAIRHSYSVAQFVLAARSPALSQQSVTVRGETLVKAGETVELKLTMDKAPNFQRIRCLR